jgi:Fe-S-cluster containining protein
VEKSGSFSNTEQINEEQVSEDQVNEDQLKQILLKIIQEKLHNKHFGTSILSVFNEVLDFAETIIETLEVSGESPEISCQSGCSFCCYSQVKIIPIEVLSIYSFIRSSYDAQEISNLQTRLSDIQGLTCGKTFEEIYAIKKQLPCIFLSDKKCSIYSMRPSICRSWNSLDSNACGTAFNSDDHNLEIESSPGRNYVFGAVRELFQGLSNEKYLQADKLQMYTALSDCFNNSDPLVNWAMGDKIFNY